MSVLGPASACPCGSGLPYDACCGPLHRNERAADGVEELMRSRYSAYVVGASDHLFRTWHPRTRPLDLTPDENLVWTGLEVVDVVQEDTDGVVEFRAHWTWNDQTGALHERSRFEVRGGRWVYVEGDTRDT
ncbi:SEC-C motif-containing protein [Marmoricola sp. OAE513]|uniref:YchJ family protein n=1 Tax=Marmoricola sp. OAE513 TaxID=2817894 RepID=UPI001AE68128